MKQKKIKVVVHPDPAERQRIIRRILVECGISPTCGQASSLIRSSVYDIDLQNAYFVAADGFNFRESVITTQRLYEMSVNGLAVIVGCRSLPKEMEFICESYYE